ncbi:MAG: SDR family oxidoreductase [Nevskiaceae bacterium]|nr:MAG: SDR family oxidoreductase [Nevskiaceae bacterium]
MNELKNKVAIITGATGGIGRAAASRFAEEGARLVLADLDADLGEALVKDIRELGGDAIFVRTDVAKPHDHEHLVEAALKNYGRLDAAFNNAGISDGPMPPGLVEYPLELWDRIIAINLSGVFYAMRAQIPAMLKNGGGSIVNTGSVASQIAFAGVPGYVAAKHGVLGLTKAAALEYGARGLRCNVIAPGIIETPMTAPVLSNAQFREHTASTIPAGRVGRAEEIADMALWLCSDRGSYANGACFAVDGGYLAR